MTLYAWHVHHGILFEPLTEPIEARIAYIEQVKAEKETPTQIATRLRLLKVITGPEIEEYDRVEQAAWAEYERVEQAARAEYNRIRQVAWVEYNRVEQAAWDKIEALHAEQCPDCPWDGRTIFPNQPTV